MIRAIKTFISVDLQVENMNSMQSYLHLMTKCHILYIKKFVRIIENLICSSIHYYWNHSNRNIEYPYPNFPKEHLNILEVPSNQKIFSLDFCVKNLQKHFNKKNDAWHFHVVWTHFAIYLSILFSTTLIRYSESFFNSLIDLN